MLWNRRYRRGPTEPPNFSSLPKGFTSSFSVLQPGIAVFFSIVSSSAFWRAAAAACAVLICLCSAPVQAHAMLDVQKSMNTKGDAPWTLKSDKLVSIDDGVIVSIGSV